MKRIVAALAIALLVVAPFTAPAFALPLEVEVQETPEQDLLEPLVGNVHELGDDFPPDELIISNWEVTDLTACNAPPGDNPGMPNILVTMINLSSFDWGDVHYVADMETQITNFDGFIGNLGFGDPSPAFRIDNQGLNRPLILESMAQDNVFQSGETWEFIIQDWQSPSAFPTPFASPGIGLLSNADPASSGSILAVMVEGNAVEVDVFPGALGQIDLIHPDGFVEGLDVSGPVEVHVYFEGQEGAASDDDGDGLDEVQTEIVGMSLTGASSLGPIRVTKAGASPGQMTEQLNANRGRLDIPPFSPPPPDFSVDSFFDITYVIDLPGGPTIQAAGPKRLEGIITHKPPAEGESIADTCDPVELLDEAGQPTGFFLGCTRIEFNPALPPEPGIIIVEKQTDPDGSVQTFEFSTSYGPNFLLADGQTNNSGPLAPGVYSVQETNLPAGWSLTSATCSDGSDPGAIDLDPGETVLCTFSNTREDGGGGIAVPGIGTWGAASAATLLTALGIVMLRRRRAYATG